MNNVTLLEPSQTEQLSDVLYGPIQPELLREEVLADLLEASARRHPEQIALICGERQLSYGELDRQAGQVASKLIQAGVQPGQIVGLWLPRGLDLLVMQAGIAKAGAAWLPLDQDTPVERLQICMEDASAVGIVSCDALAPALGETGLTLWTAEALLAPTDAPLVRRCGALPDHAAYVIYTSGSTGKPKGILISQRSICHFLRSENAILGIRASDRIYQGFSVAFDMSFEEIWIAYLVGATLWIGPKEASGDPEVLPRLLNQQRISVLHAVPTLLALFSEYAGVLGPMVGASRRYDGPMGKSDRAFVLGVIATGVAFGLINAQWINGLFGLMALLLLVTLVNRVRKGLKEAGTIAEQPVE